MPAVIATLLYQIAVDTGTDCSVVSKGKWGSGCYTCSYCSSVTSECCG